MTTETLYRGTYGELFEKYKDYKPIMTDIPFSIKQQLDNILESRFKCGPICYVRIISPDFHEIQSDFVSIKIEPVSTST